MKSFETYFTERFQEDLQTLYSTIPENSLHHNDKATFTIQYERLTNKFNHLEFLAANRPDFIISLYFTVLVDQVFYTYYQPQYPAFKEHTNSPKFIGNCLSACRYNLHPANILTAANKGCDNQFVSLNDVSKSAPFVEKYIKYSLKNNFPSIQDDFWYKCRKEMSQAF
jgi:hypothetical protein